MTLTDRSNISNMTAVITQPKTGFTNTDGVGSGVTTKGNIKVNRTYFSGLWRGTFHFDIKFVRKN